MALIKVLSHGTGSGGSAADYLLGEFDHNGIKREEVKVLRGDPRLVAQVADSLDFKHRYTSAVLAFAPDDKPTDEQIKEMVDDFWRAACGGLSPDRVAFSAIWHGDKGGGGHVHFFIARADLKTGKSFNPAPPGWQTTFDPLCDMHNFLHGWARPGDPARARDLQPGHSALIEASALRRGMKYEPDAKLLITQYLLQRIDAGKVTDRAGVLSALKDAGFTINREGKDYISVKDDETGQKLRLKGAIYEQNFTPSRTIEIADSIGARSAREPDIGRAEQASREFEAAIKRRAQYNEKRYFVRERTVDSINQQRSDANPGPLQTVTPGVLDGDAFAGVAYDPSLHADRDFDVDVAADRAISGANSEQRNAGWQDIHTDRRFELDDLRSQQEVIPLRSATTEIGEIHERSRHPANRGKPFATITKMPRLSAFGSITNGEWPGKSLLHFSTRTNFQQSKQKTKSDTRLQPASATTTDTGSLGAQSRSSPATSRRRLRHDRERNVINRITEEAERSARAAVRAIERASAELVICIERERQTEIGTASASVGETDEAASASVGETDEAANASVGGSDEAASSTDVGFKGASAELVICIDRERQVQSGRASASVGTIHEEAHSDFGDIHAEASRELLGSPPDRIREIKSSVDAGIEIVKQNNDNEIRRFKLEINLAEFFQNRGYVYNKKESSKNSAVMSSGSDKLIVATDDDGHAIYFNVNDGKDNGTIIDFIQRRDGLNLGQVRKLLRPCLGETSTPLNPINKPVKAPVSSIMAQNRYYEMPEYMGSYLQSRGISNATVKEFADNIKQDNKGNVCFRHRDPEGVTGYEIKNDGFTGFASGGQKSLFVHIVGKKISRIVITESAVDCMSYHQLKGQIDTLYISIAGQMSDKQREIIKRLLINEDQRVICAFDNDEQGDKFDAFILEIRPNAIREVPEIGKDWNDQLKADTAGQSWERPQNVLEAAIALPEPEHEPQHQKRSYRP